jgi:hypothetical protein
MGRVQGRDEKGGDQQSLKSDEEDPHLDIFRMK